MADTTMRIKVGTKQHKDLIRAMEKGRQWSHQFALWDIEDIKRIERTDMLRVHLTNGE
jgi:hypothetical protein